MTRTTGELTIHPPHIILALDLISTSAAPQDGIPHARAHRHDNQWGGSLSVLRCAPETDKISAVALSQTGAGSFISLEFVLREILV